MSPTTLVSTLLVDQELKFRQDLRTMLEDYNHSNPWRFQIVGEATTIEQTVKLTLEEDPSLILLDLDLASDQGVSILRRLQDLCFSGKVLVLSAQQEDEQIFRAMKAGAKGYICKTGLANQLDPAIATIMNNQIYLSAEVATSFFRVFHFYAGRSLQACQSLNLTEREQEVLYWLVQGFSNEEIAQHLYISVATVKAHLTAIFEKLEVNRRTQAIIKALKLGLVSA